MVVYTGSRAGSADLEGGQVQAHGAGQGGVAIVLALHTVNGGGLTHDLSTFNLLDLQVQIPQMLFLILELRALILALAPSPMPSAEGNQTADMDANR